MSFSSAGIVTGLKPGTATITATTDAISGSEVLTVSPAPLVSIAVTPVNPSVRAGEPESSSIEMEQEVVIGVLHPAGAGAWKFKLK